MRKFITIYLFFLSSLMAQTNIELTYPQTAFNSDTCCWRKLSKKGKFEEGAQLIVDYLKTNHPKNDHSLNWHAAQLFASAGNTKIAIKYIRKTYNGFYYTF